MAGKAESVLGLLLWLAAVPALAQFENDFPIDFHGAGWMQTGTIVKTTDTVTSKNNYARNFLENAGALFNMDFGFGEGLQGSLGMGAIKTHNPLGSANTGNLQGVQLGNFSFVNMARFTYELAGAQGWSPLRLTTGLFSYKYDDNIKNLGLYLIRGSVYPQILQSGFETKEMVMSANMLGAHMRNDFGPHFRQDLLLVSETELKPKYDFSLIYVATVTLGRTLELGGGVNFYHFLPARSDATSPSAKYFDPAATESGGPVNILDRKYALDKDTVVLDSADRPLIPPERRSSPADSIDYGDSLSFAREWYTHQGIKLMARFAFDPKPWLGGLGALGRNDLKLYGEAAIIGLKSYEVIYRDVRERIPVMVGFNLPAFKLLDELSLEVEYFDSPYMPDYAKVMEFSSPIPRSPYWNRSSTDSASRPYDVNADNWKWSLYASKVLAGHVKISAQAASDHFRIGSQQPWFPTYDETFAQWKDWYFMGKLAFFF